MVDVDLKDDKDFKKEVKPSAPTPIPTPAPAQTTPKHYRAGENFKLIVKGPSQYGAHSVSLSFAKGTLIPDDVVKQCQEEKKAIVVAEK